jgi:hypothetical protein
MSATLQRDQACDLARLDPKKALEKALQTCDPWFRAQALSWVARFTDGDPVPIAELAAKAAGKCDGAYKRTAVRAWEVACLAERSRAPEARKVLRPALEESKTVTPLSSRSEALMLLLEAAFAITNEDAKTVYDELQASCGQDSRWRCKRAVRDGAKLISGESKPRPFFW